MAIAVARRAARRRSPAARLPASITSLAGAGSKPVNDAAPLAGSENVVQDVRTIPSFAGKRSLYQHLGGAFVCGWES